MYSKRVSGLMRLVLEKLLRSIEKLSEEKSKFA